MKALKEARTHRRWRDQVARLIALACEPDCGSEPCDVCDGAGRMEGSVCTACRGTGCMLDLHIDRILGDRVTFDVHAARSYAERLIAEGERLERERVVFADWTQERGLGPENREPGAFVVKTGWFFTLDAQRHSKRRPLPGGWPGPLACEWGTVRCEACARGCANCGSPARAEVIAGDDGEWFCSTACHDDHDENSCPLERGFGEVQRRRRRLHGDRCKFCKGRGYVKHPKREAAAVNGGAWMIRAGRRLLAALEGQPSECQRCKDAKASKLVSCGVCRGTGHNLAGTLPAFVLPCETYNAHVLARAERQHAERCRASAIASFAERMRRASAHATD